MEKEKAGKTGVQIESSSRPGAYGAFINCVIGLIALYKPDQRSIFSDLDRRHQFEMIGQLLRLFGIDREVLEDYAASPANEVSDVDPGFLQEILSRRPRRVSRTK